ncbi:hypothetical protein LTR53_010072 [Teratosphaeriaceae sp. CCFEE 6253]|nr:hypothetical protein LTR53_010072 [Teratosphaeriaceae sp. CCFEE 6253]
MSHIAPFPDVSSVDEKKSGIRNTEINGDVDVRVGSMVDEKDASSLASNGDDGLKLLGTVSTTSTRSTCVACAARSHS